jgi:hypothetical protein
MSCIDIIGKVFYKSQATWLHSIAIVVATTGALGGAQGPFDKVDDVANPK